MDGGLARPDRLTVSTRRSNLPVGYGYLTRKAWPHGSRGGPSGENCEYSLTSTQVRAACTYTPPGTGSVYTFRIGVGMYSSAMNRVCGVSAMPCRICACLVHGHSAVEIWSA